MPPVPSSTSPIERRLASSLDLLSIAWALSVLVTGLWAVRGGWHLLTHPDGEWWRIAASLTGMWTSLCGIVGLVLTARVRWIERASGLDRLFVWHRIAGDSMGLLLAAHVVTSVLAEQRLRGGIGNTIVDLTGRESYMALATIGTAVVAIVIVTSLRAVRRRLSYETWYFLHLTVYFGLALSLPHQLTLGSTFAGTLVLQVFWVVLTSAAFATALFGRWWKLLGAVAHPLKVTSVHRENDRIVSITLGGKAARRFSAEPGQFVTVRLLREGQWWKANPYSLSARPDRASLRITVKDRGDASSGLIRAKVGDRVAVEGPYGVQTPDIFSGRRPVLIAGGIGVTPVCSILASLPDRCEPVVLLRGHTEHDLPLLDEITSHAERLGGTVRTVIGPTPSLGTRSPFSAEALRGAVGGLENCVALVAGPPSLLHAARSGLRAAGMARTDIHMELPWW